MRFAYVMSIVVLLAGVEARGAGDDPWAAEAAGSNPDAGVAPSTLEEQEAAALAPGARPQAADPAAARRPATAKVVRAKQATDERRVEPSAAGGEATTSLAIELATSGFASGALNGGLLIGARLANGIVLGGEFDYTLSSLTLSSGGTSTTASTQQLRIGAGLRHLWIQTQDKKVDFYGAADAAFLHAGVESGMSVSANGFSLAFGPGLRLWVHDAIAIGYAAQLRLTYLSGASGVFANPPSAAETDASATTVGFDGTFQILGVF